MQITKFLTCAVLLIVFGLATQNTNVESARILTVFPQGSRSHYIAIEQILKELARRGHEVTSASNFPQSKPLQNFRDVKLKLMDEYADIMQELLDHAGERLFIIKIVMKTAGLFIKFVESVFDHPEMQEIMANEQFDLVIMEAMMGDLFIGFGAHFNCPIVAFSSLETNSVSNSLVGNPNSVSFVPQSLLEYKEPMNFWERVINTIGFTVGELMRFMSYSQQISIYNQYFPSPKYPSFEEMRKNISLVLVNYHFSQGNPRPNVPGLIEIGGVQVKEKPDPLPEDLQQWMDDASDGVIFMSMGSNVKSAGFSEEKLNAFLKTFAKLKQRIVWKFENETLPGLPKNIFISKWLPQDDLLAHPNLKLFITHGGLGSILEAKVHAVPIIGIPLFGDQVTNVQVPKSEGWGLDIHYSDVTEDTLTNAIQEILSNTSYKTSVQKLSAIFRDRPQSPLETAIFWIEYVLRHHGAKHIQSNSIHLNFFQLHSLDVIGFLVAIASAVLYIQWKILKCVLRKIFGKSNKSKVD